jgi:hypothetical protein
VTLVINTISYKIDGEMKRERERGETGETKGKRQRGRVRRPNIQRGKDRRR